LRVEREGVGHQVLGSRRGRKMPKIECTTLCSSITDERERNVDSMTKVRVFN
jgi:hypothetical protein